MNFLSLAADSQESSVGLCSILRCSVLLISIIGNPSANIPINIARSMRQLSESQGMWFEVPQCMTQLGKVGTLERPIFTFV
jgi:hypothetical protein